MNAAESHLPTEIRTSKVWRVAPWVGRLILLWPTVVLTFVGLRGLLRPVQFGLTEGISFQSLQGIALGRVAFGAFPLGCALFAWWCVLSKRRIGQGLSFVAILMGTAVAVRIVGIGVDHALGRNLMLLVVESIMLSACLLAIVLERRHSIRLSHV